jgi:hypothetical protein
VTDAAYLYDGWNLVAETISGFIRDGPSILDGSSMI